jgi:hypothetical protein
MIYNTRSEIVAAVIDAYNNTKIGKEKQLYNCKAWIWETDVFDFTVLKSYSSIVAAYQRSTGILWVFGFYSRTTAQHIAKFRNWIRYEYQAGWNYPITIRLYNDSRTSKRVAKKNLEDDFESVIVSALNQY